ncbi:MAG: hypothetical protein R8J94_03860 [Acidimicrobiia bacterium]|nr:hypothetical protein [Acidimicrobiia bacterium]
MANSDHKIYCVNVGVVGALAFVVSLLFMVSKSDVSENQFRLILIGAVVVTVFAVLSSISVLSRTSIRFLSPIRSTLTFELVDEVVIMPINSLGDGRQLGLRSGDKNYRLPNVTSRTLNEAFLSDLAPQLQRWWLEGGDAPSQKYWLCH